MTRKLIIDGNAVYEIDEECMLKNRLDNIFEKEENKKEHYKHGTKSTNTRKSTTE